MASNGSYSTVDLLDPAQRTLFNQIGSYYSNAMSNGGFPQYTGQYAAPMNAAETQAISNEGDLANWFANQRSSFTPGYINPETDANELRNLNQQFYGANGQPGSKDLAEEQYAGSGGYWGGARAQGVMNDYNTTVTNPYQNWRSTALQNSYSNALNYATNASAVNTANQNLQQIPRMIQQYGLDQAYKEFIRTRPESAGNIDNMLKYTDITTQAQKYTPGQNSQWGTIGGIAGTVMGAMAAPVTGGTSLMVMPALMGGIGSLFDNNNGGGGYATSNMSNAGSNAYSSMVSRNNAMNSIAPYQDTSWLQNAGNFNDYRNSLNPYMFS